MTKITDYQLQDRYSDKPHQVFLTGTQALVRIMLDQARRDQAAGLRTGGFVSGYRGSPLGAVDKEMHSAERLLQQHHIDFLPAINEELGATAILGAQQAPLFDGCDYEGLFSIWYGKGPGVDRAGDALKHGNHYGSHTKGGVLVVAGDDHGCVSSSMPHQSDPVFIAWQMPILNPANVAEYLQFAEYGFALSRFSGNWVAFKAISETLESAATVTIQPDRQFQQPDYQAPSDLYVRKVDLPGPEIEQRMYHKLEAVQAFMEANPIDQCQHNLPQAKFGFVSTGKAHLDLLEALRLLGVDESTCQTLGIDIYKVGMVWPLARMSALDYVAGKEEVLVIEEKRGVIESQLKEYFYDWPGQKPKLMVGKHDENGAPLLPWVGEMDPLLLVPVVAQRLHRFFPQLNLPAKAAQLQAFKSIRLEVAGAKRIPYYCSGCPHNTSTKLPAGSEASLGIGCHVMAGWMDRDSYGCTQMGGEGVSWSALSRYNGKQHRFQNMGEGTWYHSGSLAIRQAVAAGANITYKVLYNDAVAMTGGQTVDGPISVHAIAQASVAEGIAALALVSDQPEKFVPQDLPSQVTIHHRDEMQQVQERMRDTTGVTVIIYEQTCATEKRRRRKAGTLVDPQRFPIINHHVCEACGDCSVQSNCLSVEPRATELGRKRKVNLSSCNKDFSCLQGFCPSFVTVEGTERAKPATQAFDYAAWESQLPLPDIQMPAEPVNVLVTGVGGTGVVTVGAVLTMAAQLENKGASVLDFTGFAQKFGTVLSYVRIAPSPQQLNQVRIQEAGADVVIACDLVVSSSPQASKLYHKDSKIVLNMAEMPTGDLVLQRDASLRVDLRRELIEGVVGKSNLQAFDANEVAERLLGNTVFANVMMLGYSWQCGKLPVSLAAMQRAIELNGVAVDTNKQAFLLGRIMAEDSQALAPPKQADTQATTLDQSLTRNLVLLTAYQNKAYAKRYQSTLQEIWSLAPTLSEQQRMTIADTLRKLMAYKDEYEVARLYSQTDFKQELQQRFVEGGRLIYHLAPPFLPLGKDHFGRPKKIALGPWVGKLFIGLARCKGLRGTPFDLFGYTAERRMERALVPWFVDNLKYFINTQDLPDFLRLANEIRGFGPVKQQSVIQIQAQVVSLRQS